jgi:hypothetical protein
VPAFVISLIRPRRSSAQIPACKKNKQTNKEQTGGGWRVGVSGELPVQTKKQRYKQQQKQTNKQINTQTNKQQKPNQKPSTEGNQLTVLPASIFSLMNPSALALDNLVEKDQWSAG